MRKTTPGQRPASSIAKPPVLRRLLLLWLATLPLALMTMLIDARWGLSLLWGFSVSLLPAACFAWYATRHSGARAAAAVVNGFYRAEAVKFVLTAILFALVFQRVDQIHLPAFFLAFIAAQIIAWVLTAQSLRRRPG